LFCDKYPYNKGPAFVLNYHTQSMLSDLIQVLYSFLCKSLQNITLLWNSSDLCQKCCSYQPLPESNFVTFFPYASVKVYSMVCTCKAHCTYQWLSNPRKCLTLV